MEGVENGLVYVQVRSTKNTRMWRTDGEGDGFEVGRHGGISLGYGTVVAYER